MSVKYDGEEKRRGNDQLDRIEEMVNDINKTLNGTPEFPGMKTDIALLKEFQMRMEKNYDRGWSLIVKLVVVALGGGVDGGLIAKIFGG